MDMNSNKYMRRSGLIESDFIGRKLPRLEYSLPPHKAPLWLPTAIRWQEN
jgi:hypothetical protein